MKRVSLLLAVLFCVGSLFAQDAKVVALSDSDSKEAKQKYDALQKAQNDWDAEQKKISNSYTVVSENDPDKGNEQVPGDVISGTTITCGLSGCYTTEHPDNLSDKEVRFYRRGFDATDGSFEFSSDFKFIVPKRSAVPQQTPYCGTNVNGIYYYNGCSFTIPTTLGPSLPTTSTPPVFVPFHSPFSYTDSTSTPGGTLAVGR